MDEVNPNDTANRATGPNTVPATSAKSAQTRPIDGTNLLPPQPVQPSIPTTPHIPPTSQTSIPVQNELVLDPVQASSLPSKPLPPTPPVQPVQTAQPSTLPTQNIPGDAATPIAGESLVSRAPPSPKPLRDDIARIINKIKLPERITLKMMGAQPKPPAPPPTTAVPPAVEKEAVTTEAAMKTGEDASARALLQSQDIKKEGPSSVTSVHTLKDDMLNIVRVKKMSLVRAAALESEKKKDQEPQEGSHLEVRKELPRKVIGYALVGVILFALALFTFLGVKSLLNQGAENAQETVLPSLIFAEKTVSFPQEARAGNDLKRTLMIGMQSLSNITLGSIIRVVPTSPQIGATGATIEQVQSIGDFLIALETRAMPELIRSFRGDFFLGFHRLAGTLSPVLIIPVTSYERAFAGMLAWEPTMSSDLSPIFTSVPPQTQNDKGLFVERQFQDALINNYDVRFISDDLGTGQLMYSFPTRTMLIIAESPHSFTEVLSRLRASREL